MFDNQGKSIMEYTDKKVLELMNRTDFRNLPKVAKEVITKFPELAFLIKSTLSEGYFEK